MGRIPMWVEFVIEAVCGVCNKIIRHPKSKYSVPCQGRQSLATSLKDVNDVLSCCKEVMEVSQIPVIFPGFLIATYSISSVDEYTLKTVFKGKQAKTSYIFKVDSFYALSLENPVHIESFPPEIKKGNVIAIFGCDTPIVYDCSITKLPTVKSVRSWEVSDHILVDCFFNLCENEDIDFYLSSKDELVHILHANGAVTAEICEKYFSKLEDVEYLKFESFEEFLQLPFQKMIQNSFESMIKDAPIQMHKFLGLDYTDGMILRNRDMLTVIEINSSS